MDVVHQNDHVANCGHKVEMIKEKEWETVLNFEKPTYKITEYIENNNYGKFELEPVERGFGTTIGNALRSVMMS